MTLIGKLICRLREICGIRPVHRYVRRNDNQHEENWIIGPYRFCTRCDHTVAVKPSGPRKPKKQEA